MSRKEKLQCVRCGSRACGLITLNDKVWCADCAEKEMNALRTEVAHYKSALDRLRPPRKSNYEYCRLPADVRVNIAAGLGLYHFEPDHAAVVFARAIQAGKLEELETAIEKARAALAEGEGDE
jgi:hypothetical protein